MPNNDDVEQLQAEVEQLRQERDNWQSNAEVNRKQAERYANERDTLRQRCEVLEADKARLDWLENALRDEGRWADISMKFDDEDGFWLSRIKRGIVLTEHNYEPAETAGPNATIREALDAAISAQAHGNGGEVKEPKT